MLMSKPQLMSLTSKSRIEELPRVQRSAVGGEGSPGLLDLYGWPQLQHGQDLHHLQQPADHEGLLGGAAKHHQEELHYCHLWYAIFKKAKVFNSSAGECTPESGVDLFLITWTS